MYTWWQEHNRSYKKYGLNSQYVCILIGQKSASAAHTYNPLTEFLEIKLSEILSVCLGNTIPYSTAINIHVICVKVFRITVLSSYTDFLNDKQGNENFCENLRARTIQTFLIYDYLLYIH